MKDTGGPAFPVVRDIRHYPNFDTEFGATLRDFFAAKAMEGFLVCDVKYASDAEMIARDAYTMADAMLKERAK